MLSKGLHEHGVRHHVQPGAGASVPPAWVARVLAQVDRERLTRPEFVALWGDHDLALRTAAWNSLVRVAATEGKDDVRIGITRRIPKARRPRCPRSEQRIPRGVDHPPNQGTRVRSSVRVGSCQWTRRR